MLVIMICIIVKYLLLESVGELNWFGATGEVELRSDSVFVMLV